MVKKRRLLMSYRQTKLGPGPSRQQGISILVALVMLLVLTLLGVSSMNTSIVELKMATSAQQQGIALNRAEELLRVGENNVTAILTNPAAYDFAAAGDGYYISADDINVRTFDWPTAGLVSIKPEANVDDSYVVEYLGAKPIPGESVKIATDGRIIGGAVHTFRITTRSVAGKGAVRLVQSLFVSEDPP
jgi:type IV pilus assembly protein PilX